jgi:hypothetical protein
MRWLLIWRIRFAIVFVLGTAFLTPSARAQVPLGPEFQINSYTTAGQFGPSIASDSAGNFTVIWNGSSDGNGDADVYARKYLASGAPLSSEFRVNTSATGFHARPSVAADANGRIVAVWDSPDDTLGGNGFDVLGRQFDSGGTAGLEFRVNSYTTLDQGFTSVGMDPSGNFVVAWTSLFQDGNGQGVFAQRYNATAVPSGPEFQVNTYTTSSQAATAVGMDAAGRFVIVWTSFGQDGSSYGVFAKRYDAAGVEQASEFQVNTYTSGQQYQPSLAVDKDGRFLVVWAGGGRLYDAAGLPQGPEFKINAYTPDTQRHPRASFLDDGGFVVVWEDAFRDGDRPGVFGRAFTSNGVPRGPDFQVNSYTTGYQFVPAVTSQPGGQFVVAWVSVDQYSQGPATMGRRFTTDVIFRDGFETGDVSRWSSSAGGGDLSASAAAAMNLTGTGLQGVVNDTGSLYVQDATPVDENHFRARFFFDPNGFDPGEGQSHFRTRIFLVLEENPTRRLAAIVIKRQGGAYSVMGRCRLDDGSQADTGFYPISDGPHAIEIEWRRSSGPTTNDGRFELWIDGASAGVKTNLENSVSSVDSARMGVLSVKSGATGTPYWDEFESRRFSYIGN